MELLNYDLSPKVRAFSTLRYSGDGGEGAYASFNLTHYCGDSPEHVSRCRAELCQELGITNDCLLLPRQTHTARVLTIDADFLCCSLEERARRMENVDALVAADHGLCIGISTADCVPILLVDETAEVIAAVHAGWRGLVTHIPEATVAAMQALGAQSHRLRAVIGPSIGPASFEVGEEVVEAFRLADYPQTLVYRSPSVDDRRILKNYIDLWAAAAHALERAGLLLDRILIAGVDTYTHTDTFFSARRLGLLSGRTYSGILLR